MFGNQNSSTWAARLSRALPKLWHDLARLADALCTVPHPLAPGWQEPEPMGTAGPLALAKSILDDGSGEPFYVLNRWGGGGDAAGWVGGPQAWLPA